MGILIKGIEMPKNCNECPLHFYEGQAICCCRALPAIEDGEILKPWKNKRKDCPLVEVPAPHGRLIDVDTLMDEGMDIYHMDYFRGTMSGYSKQMIDCTPTVLEAEGKDDG